MGKIPKRGVGGGRIYEQVNACLQNYKSTNKQTTPWKKEDEEEEIRKNEAKQNKRKEEGGWGEGREGGDERGVGAKKYSLPYMTIYKRHTNVNLIYLGSLSAERGAPLHKLHLPY